jgi:hypothetical protein
LTWELNDSEFEALTDSPGPKRYEYFIKRSADMEQVWGLTNDEGWASGKDDDSGSETFAVWPHKRYAEACAKDEWEGRTPEAIDMKEWLDGWLPDLEKDGRKVAVFPVPSGVSVNTAPDQVGEDLRTELSRY